MAGISFHLVLLSCVLPHTFKIAQHFLLMCLHKHWPQQCLCKMVEKQEESKTENNGLLPSREKCKHTLPLQVEQ